MPPQSAPDQGVITNPASLDVVEVAFALLEQSPHATLWFNSQGTLLYANPAALTLLNLAHTDLNHLTIFTLQPQLSAATWAERWRTLQRHSPDTFQQMLRTTDATLVLVTTTATMLHHNHQTVLVWTLKQCTPTPDLPELHFATERLDTLQMMRELFASMPIISYLVDPQLHLIALSNYMAERFNVSPHAVIGQPLDHSALVPEPILADWRTQLQHVFSTGRTLQVKEQITLADEVHIFQTDRFPLFDEHGAVAAVGNLSTDITQSYVSEQHLRDNEHRLQTMVQLNQHLLRTEQARVAQLEALRTTMNEISSELSLPVLLRSILERAMLLTGGNCGELALYDSKQDMLQVMVSINVGDGFEGRMQQIHEGSMGYVARTRQALIYDNYRAFTPLPPGYEQTNLERGMVAPLLAGDTLVGVIALGVDHARPHFTAADLELLQLFADQAMIAIRNAQHYSEARRHAEEADILRQAGAVVASTLDRVAMLRVVLEQLAAVIEHDSASVQMVRENMFETVAGRNLPPGSDGFRYPITESDPSYPVVMYGEPIVRRVVNNERFLVSPTFDHINAWMAVPVKVHGQVIGIITIDSTNPHAFDERDVYLASAFADTVAVALENARLYEEVYHLATIDGLLQVFNRRRFFELAQQAWAEACSAEQPMVAAMLDVDNFKRINDTHGHAAGDQVLRAVAAACRDTLPPEVIIGRYGGEEIALIFVNTTLDTAAQIVEGLRQYISQQAVPYDAHNLYVTVSIGVAAYPEHQATSLDALIDCADQALITAKRTGKNRVVRWSSDVPILLEFKEPHEYLNTIERDHEFSAKELVLLRRMMDQAKRSMDYHRHIHELLHAFDATLLGLARVVDMRDQMPSGHTEQVANLAVQLAAYIGIPDTEQPTIRRGALLHAIGKLGLPDTLLGKIGSLTPDEKEQLRRYPKIAYAMFNDVAFLRPALVIPLSHSEWWDGSGYPQGLRDHEIPLAARIVAVVDVWDTLRRDRPYRKAWSADQARAYLEQQAGTQFDPYVVRAFLQMLAEEA